MGAFKKVILIGDCIRRDYQPTVRKELEDIAEVRGPEETIKTTRNVLEHLKEWVLTPKPDLFHFNCGLHEIRRFRRDDPQTVPLHEFRTNLEEIFRQVRRHTNTSITWANTTPIYHKRRDKINNFGRREEDVLAYNTAAMEIASKYDVPVADLHEVTIQAGMDRYMARNGLHFTPEGYVLLGRAVAEVIRAELVKRD